ncbi:MAG: T9SS type A sorting domain-containing protein [Ignavibacteriae bacterium]|nr:T9SS type A sorting domain-containing protein [Ignavibacteriota bacterium]
MQLASRVLFAGLFLIALLFSAQVHAQDNPKYDSPPVRSEIFGPPSGRQSVAVITTPDGFDNFDLGTTESEPHISSNPRNPQWAFNAFNINAAFRTTNGMNWTASSPNFGVTAQGDPLTAYDSLGNLYYETMYGGPVGCKILRSTDNGATWTTAVNAIAGVDKNWLACDQTMGPYANYVYTVMTASPGGNFARSTDLGATWTNTFTPTTQSLPGMMVAVGPNVLGANNVSGGAVYVVTHSGTNAAGIYTFYASTDGGVTFSQKSSNQFSNLIGTELSGRSTVQGMRCRPYPMIAADNSFGPNRGRLYLVYASNNPSGNGNKSDIFLRSSTDQGTTWSNAVVVNDDPSSQNNFQFHPAIWCDKETGRLYVKFYDTRRVPTSDSMDVYATYTDDGGLTFAPNQRLTNRTFKINISGAAGPTYRGDYDAITSSRYAALAVWSDFRNAPSPNYTGMTAYFPDFAMLARAVRDTLKFTDSTTAVIKVPAVKLYTNKVKFTVSVTPPAPFTFSWVGKDSLTSYPDSVILKIKTNNVLEGNYVVTVVGQGPSGTPTHQRSIPIRVQLIGNAVAVLQPNGGEIWVQGQNKQIRWNSTGDVDTVSVFVSTNNGSTWTTVAANIPAVPGLLNWTVPATPSTQCKVAVQWKDSVSVRDESNSVFTISAPTALMSTTTDTLRAVLEVGNFTGYDTLRLSNSGTLALNWSSTGTTWANASPASGSVPVDSTRRIPVRFNSNGLLAGTYLGNLTVTGNDPFHSPLTVPMRLRVFGVARFVVTPDTFAFSRAAGSDTTRATFRIRNTGTDTLRYRIEEGLPTAASTAAAIQRSITQQNTPVAVKGGMEPPSAAGDSPDGRGGPDAFGYTWIDSDEPGGPAVQFFNISSVGTQITTMTTGTLDDGYATVAMPAAFTFYGNSYTSVNITTNGFLNFGAGSTSLSNGAIPSTAAPNNAVYAIWDDLDFRFRGKLLYYHDAANGRFIVQWDSVPRYNSGGAGAEVDTLTFQIVLKQTGEVYVNYRNLVSTTLNSSTTGIENSTGTVGLQVQNNSSYLHNNLTVLLTKDLVSWLSTDRGDGTIAPLDSQAVQIRVHPEGMSNGTYNAILTITGTGSPDIGRVRVRLDVTGGATPSVTVTSPNGGENWTIGSVRQITWNQSLVDTVKIEYSTAGRNGPYTVITSGVPAQPGQWIHPKANAVAIAGSVLDNPTGTFAWTVPNAPSTTCFVRISRKSSGTPADTSNAAFTIATQSSGDTSWTVQTSGTTSTIYWIKVINDLVAWAGGTGGVVLRTTNGGTTWQSVGGGAIGTADVYSGDALDANTAYVTTSPSATYIYKTTNGGALWTQVYTLAAAFIDGIQMKTTTEGYAVGDPVGGKWIVLKTTDSGTTWARMATEPTQVGTEAGWNNAFQLLGNNLWFGTNSSKVYRSTDLGATWASAATTGANSYGVYFNSATQGAAVFASGVTNYTTNGGTSWTAGGAAGTGQGTGITGTSGTEFWATVGTNVYYTSNGGVTWAATPKNGYTGATALWALDVVAQAGGTFGWAGGASGAIVRYRRTINEVAADVNGIPATFALEQNYPNPFNPTTTIEFALPEQATVSLKIYNLLGQEVVTLADGDMEAAFHRVVWNGRNASGAQIATGMYFYRFVAVGASGETFTSLKKLILLK